MGQFLSKVIVGLVILGAIGLVVWYFLPAETREDLMQKGREIKEIVERPSADSEASDDSAGEDAGESQPGEPRKAESGGVVKEPLTAVVCNRFDVTAQIKDSTLRLTLDTDLPGSTDVRVTVVRYYCQKGNSLKIPVNYYSKKTKVESWKSGRDITLGHAQWRLELEKKQKLLADREIDRIDDEIKVIFVVGGRQSNPAFGENNQHLSGKKVQMTGRLRTVRWSNRYPCRLPGSPATSVP